MSEVVGAIGPTVSASVRHAAASASAAPKPEEAVSTGVQHIQRLSPVIKSDPVAGVMILQYLDSDGQVQTQIPSAASVAYLRVGLTATGEAVKTTKAIA